MLMLQLNTVQPEPKSMEKEIREVQEILGHASIVTTQIYTHVSAKHKKKVLLKYNPRNSMNISL